MATLERSISHVLVVPKSIPTINRLRDAIVLRWTREKITVARDSKQGRLLAVLMPSTWSAGLYADPFRTQML